MARLDPKRITAIVDTREPPHTAWDLSPLQSIRAKLDCGDYSVQGLEDFCTIERKALPDLLACIGTERVRFSECIDRMLKMPSKVIIVESTWEYFLSGKWSAHYDGPPQPLAPILKFKSLVYPSSAISSVLGWIEKGIPIIFAGEPKQAALCASRFLYLAASRRQDRLNLAYRTAG